MAFEPAPARTPTSIGAIEVRLYKPDPASTESPAASYSVQVTYSDGSLVVMQGNLVPHLTQGQITALLAFMDDMRVQAIDQILP
jgi:hypothetical protein